MSEAAKIVDQFQRSIDGGDLAGARRLLRDDFRFSGPLDRFEHPEPYLEALARLGPMVERVEVLRQFADAEEVARFCTLHFRPPMPKSFVAEWYRVRDGKISELRIAFDARPFAALEGH